MAWTFLIVEPDAAAREQAARQLATITPAAEIIDAASGEEALALLENARIVPSMVFVEYHLPGMNGIELLGELRHHRLLARVPVAFLSQPVADRVVVTSYRLGACVFLTKPVRPHELREAVRDFAQPAVRLGAAAVVPASPGLLRRNAA